MRSEGGLRVFLQSAGGPLWRQLIGCGRRKLLAGENVETWATFQRLVLPFVGTVDKNVEDYPGQIKYIIDLKTNKLKYKVNKVSF